MDDPRLDARMRSLDGSAHPDPAFVADSTAALLEHVHVAREADASWLGRLRRDLRLAQSMHGRVRPLAFRVALVWLLLLVLVAVLAGVAIRRGAGPGNGPLIVSAGGAISAIDVETGAMRLITTPAEGGAHVSRSPDGQRIAFWQSGPAADALMVMGLDGHDRRRLAPDLTGHWAGCVDTWSPDSRFLASEVVVAEVSRIAVIDVETGATRFATSGDVVAHCPLWSPDGRSIAVALETATVPVLAMIAVDGARVRVVTGNLDGFGVDGPDTWSPDGVWIYFGATMPGLGRVYRVDVVTGATEQLTDDPQLAVAPASSPDGTLVAYIVDRSDGWDLYVANSDGSAPRRILEHGRNDGWSDDGRYVLSRWTPPSEPGGLVVVSPDGATVRIVAPPDQGCPADEAKPCDLGWGQPRP